MAATSSKLREVAIAIASFALAGMGGADERVGNTASPSSKTAPVPHPLGKTARARPLDKTAAISVDASSSVVDLGTHHVILRNVVISQNDLRITAERADATGLDFQDSRWIFTGDVHISSEYRGKLDSDEAIVQFRDSHIQTAVATGKPAQFEQTDSTTGVLARGHADNIQYAVAAGTIRLTTDAWLKYGDNNEVTAPELTYDIKGQRFVGASRPGQRVHLTIVPKKNASAAPKARTPQPPKPPPKASSESQASSAAGRSTARGDATP